MAFKRSGLGKRIGLTAAAVLFAVLLVAWINGGEVPLRAISEPIATPENAL